MGRPGPLTTFWPAGNEVVLRPATSADRALLLEWRNDQDVVRYSLSGRPVAAAEHANWLTARLAEPALRLWIAEEAGKPVGQVRVDLEDETGTVSISVAPAQRGRGVGSRMLRALLIEMEADAAVRSLVALVHRENTTSLRSFERAGFGDAGRRQRGFVVLERSVEAKR
ncbi:MAG: GNAT family N-acetyltransferase [Candidatus Dormiibacterota bacterium]